MFRRLFLTSLLMIGATLCCFGQTSALRDYVGQITQTFHPDIVDLLKKYQRDAEKQGDSAFVRGIDNYLKGNSGTGFVYVAKDGKNYIITNYHVISQATGLSVTFEKLDGEKTKFSDLTIIAADEDMDIALLSFAGGQNPFKQGLAFLSLPVEEGADVYSAGFPGLGNAQVWQFGRGIISNASVRFPESDDSDKMMGPFIQHTAEVDSGNSGGPLLVQTQGVPTGYAVAGINTLKWRGRQAANFSIPMNRVQSFLDVSFGPKPTDERARLETRVNSFVEGLSVPKAVYPHISQYLSNICVGENAEYGLEELVEKAPRTVKNDINGYDPVSVISYAVAWTIENTIRSKAGKIAIEVDSINSNDDNGFTVSFKVNDKIINSQWINEYGIWRIKTFGDVASGDKTLIKKKAKERAENARLRDKPDFQIAVGFGYSEDMGPAFAVDFKFRGDYTGTGLRGYFGGKDNMQVEYFGGIYVPIKAGSVAFTPYVDVGLGFIIAPAPGDDPIISWDLGFDISIQGGLMFITAAVPGLYFQGAYQHNFILGLPGYSPSALFLGIGYAF